MKTIASALAMLKILLKMFFVMGNASNIWEMVVAIKCTFLRVKSLKLIHKYYTTYLRKNQVLRGHFLIISLIIFDINFSTKMYTLL